MASYDYIFYMTRKSSNPRLVVLAYSRQLDGEIGLIDKGILISAISRVPDTKNIRAALELIQSRSPDSDIQNAAKNKLDEFSSEDKYLKTASAAIFERLRPLLEAPRQLPLSSSIFDGTLRFDEESPKLRFAIDEVDAIDPQDSKKLPLLIDRIVLNFTDDIPKSLLDAANRKVAQANSIEVMRICTPLVIEFLTLLHRGIHDDSFPEEFRNASRVIARCASLFRALYVSSDLLEEAFENIRDNHPDSKIREAFEKLFPKTEILPD